MILSMTGFAVQHRELGRVSLHIELRSVNSRFLDLAFRLGDDVRLAEPALREMLTARLSRGKVECRLYLQKNDAASAAEMSLNGALLQQLKAAQTQAQVVFPQAKALSVSELLRWPGMMADDSVGFDELMPVIREMASAAIDEFLASRQREGAKLASIINERVEGMRALAQRAAPQMPALVEAYQVKLTERLREAVATLDEDRIRQEVALFAQRIDVDEELDRLRTHLDEVDRILKKGGISGKRLDFLMQELNREANTLASKSAATDVTAVAMEMKVLIEQMREQVQNIE
ncbi:MAG TPA: YicC family protein [Denitromonas sp.]|uniref:YicC/YloC family endoribonuclease n=1 Tax=Denitromonas sp. TaxID=2734609 RepID=UPI001D3C70FD|nr:YicC family protein [Rhodocyclaceae bacterium]MCP5223195.1 YicC family protein [Zoogloeaceae bacterium]HPR07295.1 YicC family protein [Denitromonas sp.]HQU88564.1 YicC family protein [Denitromonas sp.]HQV14975.1 YicC family protein [Denitromonas sp.]